MSISSSVVYEVHAHLAFLNDMQLHVVIRNAFGMLLTDTWSFNNYDECIAKTFRAVGSYPLPAKHLEFLSIIVQINYCGMYGQEWQFNFRPSINKSLACIMNIYNTERLQKLAEHRQSGARYQFTIIPFWNF